MEVSFHCVKVSKETEVGCVTLNAIEILNLLSYCPALETMKLYDVTDLGCKKLRLKKSIQYYDTFFEKIPSYLDHLEIRKIFLSIVRVNVNP